MLKVLPIKVTNNLAPIFWKQFSNIEIQPSFVHFSIYRSIFFVNFHDKCFLAFLLTHKNFSREKSWLSQVHYTKEVKNYQNFDIKDETLADKIYKLPGIYIYTYALRLRYCEQPSKGKKIKVWIIKTLK